MQLETYIIDFFVFPRFPGDCLSLPEPEQPEHFEY